MEVKNKVAKGIIFIIFCLIAIAILYPLFGIIIISLKSSKDYYIDPLGIPTKLYLDNFIVAFKKSNMLINFYNSIFYTFVSCGLVAIVSLFIAYPIARKKIKFHGALFGLFTASLIMPPSLIPLYKIMQSLKLNNTYHGMIMFYVGTGVAFSVFILTGFVKLIPKELDEAAAIDGCGYFRYIFKIIFPLSKSAIATVIMLNALNVWNDFVYPYLFITKKDMRTLATGLYMFLGEYSNELTVFTAAVVIMAIPITIFYILLQKQITESLAKGAVKG